ncbi:MAG: beta-galactosidase [Armatimonadota bacterium]|nr:MAG: beta-galactosidase [Armatimonadota bacterium]
MTRVVLTSRLAGPAAGAGAAAPALRATARMAWFGLAALVVMGTAACAQQAPASNLLQARSVVARREANLIRVNGRPTVLMWARGLENVGDLDQYVALGFNTAYVLLQATSEHDLQTFAALAAEAETRGLMVVAALAPSALLDEEGTELAIDPQSEQYAAAVTEFVAKAAEAVGERSALIGWSVEAVPPEQVIWNDEGFLGYLGEWYSSLAAVNNSWGTEFGDWEEITTGGVQDIDQTKPGGLGRASVDFAYYREAAYADVLSLWAGAVRRADPGRLVFASALTDYRSIISARPDFDGMVLNTYPSFAEAEWRTHNVHAVDIARRANEFAVVQTLEVGAGTNANSLATWAYLALHHGAAGVAFSSWVVVRDSQVLKDALAELSRAVRESAWFPAQPRPRAAILYEPFGGGGMRNGQGLYGYLDGFAPNEPGAIFGLARDGTRFGQFDVLALESLTGAGLNHYGVIIAPMALYLPEEAQLALHNFVMAGGVLVADAGIAMYQADGIVTSVPDVMNQLLGLRFGVDEAAWSATPEGEVQVGEVWGGEGTPLSEMPEEAGLAYNEDLIRLAQSMEEVLDRPTIADYLGVEFLSDEAPELRVNPLGQGYAVYSPGFLYEDRDSSDPYFVELHARVLANEADLEVTEPQGLWPGVSVGVYADWSVGLASPDGAATALNLYGAGNQVYRVPEGAMRLGNPDEGDWVELLFPGASLSVATPLPIYVWTSEEEAAATVSVVRYDADRIELLVHGNGAQAMVRRGAVEVRGGLRTAVGIEIRDGTYRVPRGSLHRVTVTDGPSDRRGWEQEMMPNPDTGGLVIQEGFAWSRVVIERAP